MLNAYTLILVLLYSILSLVYCVLVIKESYDEWGDYCFWDDMEMRSWLGTSIIATLMTLDYLISFHM